MRFEEALNLPGHVFTALEEAAEFLAITERNERFRAATYLRLCDNAYSADSPSMDALFELERMHGHMRAVMLGKTDAEREWEELQALKCMPGVRVIPRGGVGNG